MKCDVIIIRCSDILKCVSIFILADNVYVGYLSNIISCLVISGECVDAGSF